MKEIACFVSPHGFGHATRAIAVVEAIQHLRPDVHAHFFTTVAKSLFAETLVNFTYHPVLVDIGLVQSSAMDADLPATIRRLDEMYPFRGQQIEDLAAQCANCSLVLCDIAPLGIAVAKRAGLPSVLVENFTWDWIYQRYAGSFPQLLPHIRYLHEWFARADYHIQTEPLCLPARRDVHCGPIFRRMTAGRTALRAQLGRPDQPLVVITMGGFFQQLPPGLEVEDYANIQFLFTGQQETRRLGRNLALLGRDSRLYHPDLLSVADVVVCKAGYSTVAECCQAGARVIAVGRADFPESEFLQAYLEARLGGVSISPKGYQDGAWMALASELISRPRPLPATENGADEVAALLCNLF